MKKTTANDGVTDDTKANSDFLNAVQQGSYTKVESLLLSGFDPNQPDNAGWTALFFAVANQDTRMAELLLKNGALPSVADLSQWTPLTHAKVRGDTSMAALLQTACSKGSRHKSGLTLA